MTLKEAENDITERNNCRTLTKLLKGIQSKNRNTLRPAENHLLFTKPVLLQSVRKDKHKEPRD